MQFDADRSCNVSPCLNPSSGRCFKCIGAELFKVLHAYHTENQNLSEAELQEVKTDLRAGSDCLSGENFCRGNKTVPGIGYIPNMQRSAFGLHPAGMNGGSVFGSTATKSPHFSSMSALRASARSTEVSSVRDIAPLPSCDATPAPASVKTNKLERVHPGPHAHSPSGRAHFRSRRVHSRSARVHSRSGRVHSRSTALSVAC